MVMDNHKQNAHVDAHPLFFDSLFPSFQSTTPETVVSDYRQRKRADSRAEHNSTVGDESNDDEVKKFSENNVEFYAEIIGKLVGTIRDGFTSLVEDVKQRKMQQRNAVEDSMEIKTGKLKAHRKGETNEMRETMGSRQTLKGSESYKMQMTNEAASTPAQKISINTHGNVTTKEHQAIKLTTAMELDDESNESNGIEKREHEQIQSTNESAPIVWKDVVQVIARRTKHKRSDNSSHQSDREKVGNDEGELNVEQLGIPTDSESFDGER